MPALGFIASHWRMVIAAGLAAFILWQHFEVVHYKEKIIEITDAQLKEVNKTLLANAALQQKWQEAMRVGFVNYQGALDKTRSDHEKQIAVRDSTIGRLLNDADAIHAAPKNTGAADLQSCQDRLVAVRGAAEQVIRDAGAVGQASERCANVASAANDCESKLQLMWDSWPRDIK